MLRILMSVAIVLCLAPALDRARADGLPATPDSGDQTANQSGNAAAVQSMDVCGDSISKGFNAQSRFPCPNADQEPFNWATSNTHGLSLCSAGPEGVFSQAERIECLRGATVISANPNSAESGAQMLKDFVNQANMARTFLSAQPAPRYIPVLMGHNDNCGGSIFRFNFSCDRGSDQDPNNYCRTTAAAFEREFRKGLDILMTIPDTHIGIASVVRLSQLCNFGGKISCQSFTNCQTLWSTVAYASWIFSGGSGICGSLTINCNERRIRDAYLTVKAYRDVLARVSQEYAAIPPGGASAIVTIGGQTVGGATKATGVTVAYSDAPWRYRFNSGQLSCCDCYHPSRTGQDAAARILFEGLRCTPAEPCCRDTGDPLLDGRCAVTDAAGFYPGLFTPAPTATSQP